MWSVESCRRVIFQSAKIGFIFKNGSFLPENEHNDIGDIPIGGHPRHERGVKIYSGRVKMMGKVYVTRTGLPSFMPGFHFGELLMTRTASASREG